MAEAMKYGTESFEVHLPPEQIAAEVEANHVDLPQRTVAEHIRYALDHPIDSAPLRELVKPGETVCIIISDVTRRWQSPETYLPILVAELEAAGKLTAVVTQNIDGLHQAAGSKTVYELHGSTLRNYCVKCGAFYDVDFIANSTGVPRCPKCGGIIKPDVVLYEEGLDEQVLSGAVSAIRRADTLIIGGTSLVVYPAAGLIRYFRGDHLVVINMQPTNADAEADLCIAKPIGQVLSEDVVVDD